MKPIISVEGLGKSYTIRHEGQTHYKSLREEIFKLPSRLLRRGGQSREEFWALKDVSFDIMPGDRVGIIGRNGAGKSTLLKLLSRITEPTTGRIILRGRVASLLEVGTGFHPELTGRENIYLNGAILGMSRAEVRRKFDEIVDFAGVEKFLDTPVKRYSSGMYVRLAFAVAAHLEPEILIVDEVLAVGDAEFQKKCLGKMEEVGKEGRTVLFVSHNMGAIQKLCSNAFLLNQSRLTYSGNVEYAINKYFNHQATGKFYFGKRYEDESIRPIMVCVSDKYGNIKSEFSWSEDFYVVLEFCVKKDMDAYCAPNVHVKSGFEYAFVSCFEKKIKLKRGTYRTCCHIPPFFLNSKIYEIGVAISSFPSGTPVHVHCSVYDILLVHINEDVNQRLNPYIGSLPGFIQPRLEWNIEQLN